MISILGFDGLEGDIVIDQKQKDWLEAYTCIMHRTRFCIAPLNSGILGGSGYPR